MLLIDSTKIVKLLTFTNKKTCFFELNYNFSRSSVCRTNKRKQKKYFIKKSEKDLLFKLNYIIC